jgi:hypothetical protein
MTPDSASPTPSTITRLARAALRSLPALTALLGGAAHAAETDGPSLGRVVELPPVTVTESRELPPPEKWRYTQIPGFEVLSNASDRAAQRLLRDFQLFQTAVGIIMPAFQYRPAVPASLILCGRGGKFDVFLPKGDRPVDTGAASLTYRKGEQAAIIVDMQTSVMQLSTPESLSSVGGDRGGTSIDGFEVDYFKLMRREYILFLLSRFEPRAPAWLEEGVTQLFMAMDYSRKYIAFAKLEDPNTISIEQANAIANAAANAEAGIETGSFSTSAPQQDRDFNAALARRGLMSMPLMFSVGHGSSETRNVLGSTWAKQCYAFVHYCIYGNNGRHQKGFLTFVNRLAKEPLSEELFKQCFGVTYRSMATELRGYIEFTNYKSIEFTAKKGQELPDVPPPPLRDATDGEVGRVKGQALILAGNLDAARLALIAPYARGDRDPQLLAELGLYERLAGRDDRARKFLEGAVAGKTTRARAYVELARMRLAEAQTQAAGKPLPTAQTAAVLSPLFAARGVPPLLPETYELIAETWERSAVKPRRDNLAVLDEGVQRFPRRVDLIYRAAVLNAQNGFLEDAAALADWGLKVAPDEAARERFAQLKATLPPPTPAPAAPPPAGKPPR